MNGQITILSEVMTWYMTNSEMTWYPVVEGTHGCVFQGTAGVDIVNFAGNLSFEICRFQHGWTAILKKAKYSSLLFLIGAGGALIYFWRKSLNNSPLENSDTPPRSPGISARSFIKWLFDEELIEDGMDDTSHVHGYYFGPSLSNNQGHTSSNDGDEENDSDDLSLNSLSGESSPHKFLKKPLYDISLSGNMARFKNIQDNNMNTPVQITNPCPKCEKGTCRLKRHQLPKTYSNTSSCYSGSPKTQMKTSTPEFLSSEDDQILQRTVASNRLTHRYYRPGFDLRMKGDGSDEGDATGSGSRLADAMYKYNTTHRGSYKGQHHRKSTLYGNNHHRSSNVSDHWVLSPISINSLESSSPACGDPSCTNSQCYQLPQMERDTSIDSIEDHSCSISGSMMDMVQNAKEIRRLIRKTSFDSQASDLDLDFNFNDSIGDSTAEGMDQLCNGLTQLIGSCDFIEDEIASLPGESKLMSSQSSMSGLSELNDQADVKCNKCLKRESSIPDFRALQKKARSNQSLWKLTGFSEREGSVLSDHSDIENPSLEWESPTHGWQNIKHNNYKVAVDNRANISDSGDDMSSIVGSNLDALEWDSECLGQSFDPDVLGKSTQHKVWLPDALRELNTEKELEESLCSYGDSQTSKTNSERSSSEKDMRLFQRCPPSGRSSVDRESISSGLSEFSTTSDDFTLTRSRQLNLGLNLSRSRSSSTSTSPLSPLIRDCPFHFNSSNKESRAKQMNASVYSQESGFLDYEGSMDSSICSMSSSIFTSSVNLSPVKEAKEPQSPIETTQSPLGLPEYGIGPITCSDTVIKVTLPISQDLKPNNKAVSKGLFQPLLTASQCSAGSLRRQNKE